MIPDINVVRGKAKEMKRAIKPTDRTEEIIFKSLDHFYKEAVLDINEQLLSGMFASYKLEFWTIRAYVENTLHFELEDDTYFLILDTLFRWIEIQYTYSKYSVFVKKIVGPKSNYARYYESYYRCQIRF